MRLSTRSVFAGALAIFMLASFFVLAPAQAGNGTVGPILVETEVDEFDAENGNEDCALREAIQAANTNAVFGGCTAGGSPVDTIQVPAGTYTLTRSASEGDDDDNTLGDLDVEQPTIFEVVPTEDDEAIIDAGASVGPSPPTGVVPADCNNLIVDPGNSSRVLHVESGGTAGMTNFRIRGGYAGALGNDSGGGILNQGELFLTDSVVEDNVVQPAPDSGSLTGEGGGISNIGAGTTLTNTTVRENFIFIDAESGGTGTGGGIASFSLDGTALIGSRVNGNGVCAEFAEGGGIGSLLTFSMEGGRIGDNELVGLHSKGGGVFNRPTKGPSIMHLMLVDIENNLAGGGGAQSYGGGIYNDADLTLDRVTVDGNGTTPGAIIGTGGAGIYHGGVNLDINKSTISNNDANTPAFPTGPFGEEEEASEGGGIYATQDMEIENSTIANNTADLGGGLYQDSLEGGPAFLQNVTVAQNEAVTDGGGVFGQGGKGFAVFLRNSIVADNTENDCAGGQFASQGFNLSSDTTCDLSGTGDLENSDPDLSDLDDNGGATQTMLPSEESPAVDRIPAQQTTGTGAQGINPGCPPPGKDQRNRNRPMDGDGNGSARCDVGSVEIGAPTAQFCPGHEGDSRNQVKGTSSGETLEGTNGPDVICGLGGNDVIRGLNGQDVLIGGNGNDDVFGGDGADLIRGNAGGDDIFAGGGNDAIRGTGGDDDIDGQNGNDRIRGGGDNDNLKGGDDNDKIFGWNGQDILKGQQGADELFGQIGADDLFGGTQNDDLRGGPGFDKLNGEEGNDDKCVKGDGGGSTVNCERT